ncbi:MAG TPA: ABC transporter ATP-binding protein, partial [Gemmatimonadales bacterium]|nr:ABC transporter ATP-binding protein [Gemmatimonadales bacterium]
LSVYRHLQRLSPRFYAKMPLGQIVSRVNADIGEIQRVAGEVALAWVGSVVFLIGAVVILIVLDPLLFAVSLIILPASIWALVRFRRKLEGAVTVMRERSAEIGTFLIDTLMGMKVTSGFTAEVREVVRFRQKNNSFIESLMAMRRLTYLSGGLPGLLLAVGSAAVFLVGGWRVIEGVITMGTLVAFLAYQMRLTAPVQGLMGIYASIATARVSLKRVREILDAPVEVSEATDAEPLPTVQGAVAFENVSFAFEPARPVLDGVTLQVRAGERVAIVGRSGEGKSTIGDLLVRQLDPDAGRITIDGKDLTQVKLADLRRQVMVVDQDPFVFHTSIFENIRYARPDASDEQVKAAAHQAGLEALLTRLPDGGATSVGERGRALSAGERQRVAMARAFLADPAVLVLDEATGALDPGTEAQVVAGYEALMRGRTTIVITHRLELARRAERAVVLDRGRIVEEGPVAELLQQRGPFAAIFGERHGG